MLSEPRACAGTLPPVVTVLGETELLGNQAWMSSNPRGLHGVEGGLAAGLFKKK